MAGSKGAGKKGICLDRGLPIAEQYGIVSQMQRAAVSVMSNIAEGKGRFSTKDFLHFLHIARGSLLEVRSLGILASDLSYLKEEHLNQLEQECDTVGKSLNSLINTLMDDLQKAKAVKLRGSSKANNQEQIAKN